MVLWVVACFPTIAGLPDQWHPVGDLRGLAARTRANRDDGEPVNHVLFLCWPPAWQQPMARNALVAYQRLGGDQLIYIGEPRGGMCADDHFFDALEAGWLLADQVPNYVTWSNFNDSAQLWSRR